MGIHQLVQNHLEIYRKNFVSLCELEYSLRDGWLVVFQTPTTLTRRLESSWAQSNRLFDALSDDDKAAVVYVLLLHVCDRSELAHPNMGPCK
jgi:hypothetical protein